MTVMEIHHAEKKVQAEVAFSATAKLEAEAMMAKAIEKKETAARSRQ